MTRNLLAPTTIALLLSTAAAPASASFINYSAKEINVKIVYAGVQKHSSRTLQYIYDRTSPDAKGKMINLATEGGGNVAFFDFLPLSLGEIRGFKTRFHLYTVTDRELYSESRKLIFKGVDGIVFVADCRRSQLEKTRATFAQLKVGLAANGYDWKSALVVYQLEHADGADAVPMAELEKLLEIGDRPHHVANSQKGDGVFTTLKSVAKLVLLALKSGAQDEAATDSSHHEPAKR